MAGKGKPGPPIKNIVNCHVLAQGDQAARFRELQDTWVPGIKLTVNQLMKLALDALEASR